MGNIASRKFDPLTDLTDLKGKVAVVTGGNTGIGLATVRHLARAGAKVYLAARDESRATGAIAQLEHDGLGPGNGEVLWLKLDLSTIREAKMAAEEFLKRETRLDILVNNAGLMQGPHTIGPDGIATMVAVNYTGPFIFTQVLIPLLQETAREPNSDVRIVNVSSIMHKMVPASVKFDSIGDFNASYKGRWPVAGFYRYAHTKLMLVLWTKTLQRRLNEDASAPITAIVIHPGGVDTFSHKWIFPRLFGWLNSLTIAGPEVGAYNSAFAAAGKRIRDNKVAYQGVYLESQPTGKFVTPSEAALNEELGEQLWATTIQVLDEAGVR